MHQVGQKIDVITASQLLQDLDAQMAVGVVGLVKVMHLRGCAAQAAQATGGRASQLARRRVREDAHDMFGDGVLQNGHTRLWGQAPQGSQGGATPRSAA